MITKCVCLQCGGKIEFEANDFARSGEDGLRRLGQAVPCPHCGQMTTLFMDRVYSPPPAYAAPVTGKTPPPPKPPESKKPAHNKSAVFILAVIGLGLILVGCATQAEAKTAFHEITAAVQYCSGWIMLGLAIVVETLAGK